MLRQPALRIILRLLAFALVLKLVPLAAALAEPQRRVAFIIGNSTYQGRLALNNPRNDAEAFAEALKKVSPKFEIVKILDMRAEDRDAVLSRLERSAANSSIALFYYAGHALQSNDDNYLLPVDMPEYPAGLDELGALRLSEVLERMKGVTRAKLVFLDACRDNPFKSGEEAPALSPDRTRTAGLVGVLRGGLASPAASGFGTGDVFIAYATAPGSVAQDGKGRNSPFTAALARYIPERGLEIKKMQMLVSKAVKQTTGDKALYSQPQVPWFSVSLTSDLYLWPPAAAVPPAPSASLPASSPGSQTAQAAARHSTRNASLPPGLGGGVGAGGL